MSMNCPRCGTAGGRYNCDNCHREYEANPLKVSQPIFKPMSVVDGMPVARRLVLGDPIDERPSVYSMPRFQVTAKSLYNVLGTQVPNIWAKPPGV